ncbi:MAG: hypothetical protein IJ738_05750 [Alphaproteobacteria bacterium]|nr:hypothetical protein [Alphaproteobacteria bacterium]MBR1757049.1 hypothetical protein [Alphaproteobacteria bacterium]
MNKTLEQRLDRFDLTAAQRDKYTNVFNRIQEARAKTTEELQELSEKIAFAGFVKGANRLILTDREIHKGKAVLCLLLAEPSADLMHFGNLKNARPAPQMRSLGTIVVYKHAYADEEPHLTRNDVLAQIPAELADKVSAFCLRLEDHFALNGYNLIAQAYEYNVELFAK